MSDTAARSRAVARVFARPTAVRWRIFFLLLLLMAINYIDRASISVAMPMIGKEFSIQPALQGVLLSAFFWTYALMQIPGGMLADRFGPRVVIATSTVGWGLFQAIAAAATGFFPLALARLGLGAAEAPLYPAGGKLNAIWMTRNERGRGATLLDGGAPLGAALGALLITGLIAEFSSWRTAFVVAGVGTMAIGVWAWFYIRNHPLEHPGVNEGEAAYLAAEQADEEAASVPGSGKILEFLRFRSVWGMFFGWMCFNTMFYGLLTWLPTYLSKTHGLNIGKLGGALFIIFFAGFIGEMVGGYLGDRWKATGADPNRVYRTLFAIGAIIATVSVFLVAYTASAPLVVALLSTTLFFLRWCGMYWSIPAILAGRKLSGFLGGLMNLGGNIGGVLVPIVVGLIVQITGSYFLALMFFAAAGTGLFISSMIIDYRHRLPV